MRKHPDDHFSSEHYLSEDNDLYLDDIVILCFDENFEHFWQ